MITIKNLSKIYPNATPLKDVSVEIQDGEVISLIGPSGTGKSTFLRCINMLETPTSGEIWIHGDCITDPKTDICSVRRKMGMVFQSFNLYPHLTVAENIMLAPMKLLKKTEAEAYSDAMELLSTVSLSEKAANYPSELSGGQKQRVAIARTLAMNPKIILFDEPTSALDPTMVGEVLAVIRALSKRGLTMLIVTHEMKFARDVSTRVFFMNEGEIYEDGTPSEIFDSPKRQATRTFVRRIKTLDITIDSPRFDFIGEMNRVTEFCRSQFITEHGSNSCCLLFEEIITLMMPYMPDEFLLNVSLAVSEIDQCVNFSFSWHGDCFDPLSADDDIAIKLVNNIASDITHTYTGDENVLSVTVKKCLTP